MNRREIHDGDDHHHHISACLLSTYQSTTPSPPLPSSPTTQTQFFFLSSPTPVFCHSLFFAFFLFLWGGYSWQAGRLVG